MNFRGNGPYNIWKMCHPLFSPKHYLMTLNHVFCFSAHIHSMLLGMLSHSHDIPFPEIGQRSTMVYHGLSTAQVIRMSLGEKAKLEITSDFAWRPVGADSPVAFSGNQRFIPTEDMMGYNFKLDIDTIYIYRYTHYILIYYAYIYNYMNI